MSVVLGMAHVASCLHDKQLATQPHPHHWKSCKWREDSSLVRVLGKATTPLCPSPLSPQLQLRDTVFHSLASKFSPLKEN